MQGRVNHGHGKGVKMSAWLGWLAWTRSLWVMLVCSVH